MFTVVTDSCADLRADYVAVQSDFHVVPMHYNVGSETYPDVPGQGLDPVEFYRRLSAGASSSTAQINTNVLLELYRPLLVAGKAVLSILLSSGLSGTYQSSVQAKKILDAENLPGKLFLVDSLAASAGEGLMVHLALQKRAEGMNAEQTAKWLAETRPRVAQWFTVDDLHFLKRGGRCSPASAFFGTLISIKPVLHVDDEGKLVARDKVRRRSGALRGLVDRVESLIEKPKDQTIFISNAACPEEAEKVRDMIHQRVGVPMDRFMMSSIGPTIGAHAGPGTIAVFFLGKNRG